MKDRLVVIRSGNRQIETRTKGGSPPTWTSNTVYQTNIERYRENFTTVNGLGGHVDRRTPTDYSFSKTVTIQGNGTYQALSANQEVIETGCINGSSMTGIEAGMPTASTASATNARNSAIAKLNEATRGTLDLSIDLFEYGQVVRMLRGMTHLVDYVRSFSPKKWSSKWLEYQYGWRPLVGTIYDAAELIVKPPKFGVVKFKARGRDKRDRVDTQPEGTLPGVMNRREWFSSRRHEIQIEMNFSNNTIQRLAQISSLNPASIIWELTPYSFVADWLVDVGGYLRAMETAYLGDLNFLSGYETSGARDVKLLSKNGKSQVSGTTHIYSCAPLITHFSSKSRSTLTSYPRPTRPSVKVDLGSSRMISGAALLREFFNRK